MRKRLIPLAVVLALALAASTFLPVDAANGDIEFTQYTLTGTAAALSTAANTSAIPRRLTVKNASGAANAVFLGGSGVTTTTNAGIELSAGQSYSFTNQDPAEIFIIGTVAAANVAFIVAEY